MIGSKGGLARLISAAMGRVGFSAPALEDLLGGADARLSPAEQSALWAHRARGPAPLAVFARLFVLGVKVSEREARRVFADDLPRAVRFGLVKKTPAGVVAKLVATLHDRAVIWADRPDGDPDALVLGPTRATFVLDAALPTGSLGRVLELGTGSGFLALRLAARARAVTATDVSARALRLAGLNEAVAQPPRPITWLRSDRYAALGRQRFDLVVGNLPFVIAPERRFTYRDSGLPEDEFVASVVAGVGRHLVPGGFAIFLAQWVHRHDEPEDEHLAPWFVAAGVDALVLRLDAEPADVYAARWSPGPNPELAPAERARLIASWAAHLARRRIQGVSTGLFVLRRRRTARHFFSVDDIPAAAATPTWNDIAARFASLDGAHTLPG